MIFNIRSLTCESSSTYSKSCSQSDFGDETGVKLLLLLLFDAFKASEIDVEISNCSNKQKTFRLIEMFQEISGLCHSYHFRMLVQLIWLIQCPMKAHANFYRTSVFATDFLAAFLVALVLD